jgi:hypothetical protein
MDGLESIRNKKIAFAVLNWGLGHATRSAAIIKQLSLQGNEIIILSSGNALKYLKSAFPDFLFRPIPDYSIKYHKGIPVWLSVLLRLPFTLISMIEEFFALKNILKERKEIDLLISDNCYGVWSPNLPSIFIGHQINPFFTIPIFGNLLNRIHHWWLNKYNQVFIPDFEGYHNLSGLLSKIPLTLRNKSKFIGHFSNLPLSNKGRIAKRVLVLLSGIEPYRMELELDLLDLFSNTKWKDLNVLVVGGKVDEKTSYENQITYHAFLQGENLANEIAQADLIICRSGYSTLMDIHKGEKRTILIPTPGQPEQEYLAKYLPNRYPNQYESFQQTKSFKEDLVVYISDLYQLS